jgi:hypothetical protein
MKDGSFKHPTIGNFPKGVSIKLAVSVCVCHSSKVWYELDCI